MPAERLSMRKVREVLRLKYACGASERVIARSVGIGRTAVAEYIRKEGLYRGSSKSRGKSGKADSSRTKVGSG